MSHSNNTKAMDQLNFGYVPVDADYSRYRYSSIDDDDSSAFSIASSKYSFSWANGRLYHDSRVGHIFPCDDTSKENEQLAHAMYLCLLDNQYFVAPIDGSTLRNVLDVGTGLGLWAEDMAERYPYATIIGLDSQPIPAPVIPNFRFMLSDASDEWVMDDPDMRFDFVHIRSLYAALDTAAWPQLYQQCFHNMESGGWIEQVEVEIEVRCDDRTASPNSQIVRLAHMTVEMSERTGRDYHVSTKMKNMIEDAGFVDVQESRQKLPIGPWSTDPKMREVGKFFERFYRTGLQGWILHPMVSTMNYTREQVDEECEKAFREIDSRQEHLYFTAVFVIGRKP